MHLPNALLQLSDLPGCGGSSSLAFSKRVLRLTCDKIMIRMYKSNFAAAKTTKEKSLVDKLAGEKYLGKVNKSPDVIPLFMEPNFT